MKQIFFGLVLIFSVVVYSECAAIDNEDLKASLGPVDTPTPSEKLQTAAGTWPFSPPSPFPSWNPFSPPSPFPSWNPFSPPSPFPSWNPFSPSPSWNPFSPSWPSWPGFDSSISLFG